MAALTAPGTRCSRRSRPISSAAQGQQTPRRRGLKQLAAVTAGLAGSVGLLASHAEAQIDLFTVSGSGVNVKEMPGPDGTPVPLRESFGFDAHYAQCIVEDYTAAFVIPTFAMGQVIIEPHAFFMAMCARNITLVSVRAEATTLTVTGRSVRMSPPNFFSKLDWARRIPSLIATKSAAGTPGPTS